MLEECDSPDCLPRDLPRANSAQIYSVFTLQLKYSGFSFKNILNQTLYCKDRGYCVHIISRNFLDLVFF